MRNHRTKHLLVSDWKLAFASLLFVCHHVLKLCQPHIFVAWVYFSFDAVFDTDERYDGEDAVDTASLFSLVDSLDYSIIKLIVGF